MTKKKETRGRPRHKRTEKIASKIKKLLLEGHTRAYTAFQCGINITTMKKYYNDEVESSAHTVRSAVQSSIIQRCMTTSDSRDNNLLIFFAKTQLKWREADADNAQLQPQINIITNNASIAESSSDELVESDKLKLDQLIESTKEEV